MDRREAGKVGWEKTKEKHEARHRKFVEAYEANPKKCLLCGAEISFFKRYNDYCSQSCGTAYRYGRRGTRLLSHPCKECGKDIKNHKNRTFCSHKCVKQFTWKQACLQMEETGALLPLSSGYGYNPVMAKRYLAEKRGRKCEICGGTEWCGQLMPLLLDHINGDPENHALTNVRLVCGNCNMLLPTFAGRNLGKGRDVRAKRVGIVRKKVYSRVCVNCGKRFKPRQNKTICCSIGCARFQDRRVERPSREYLEKTLWEKPTTHIAKEFGVSDKAVKNWVKSYGISSYPPRGWWSGKKILDAPMV